MKKILLTVYYLFFIVDILFAQNVGIGTSTPHASALLDITSNTKGLLIPRMNTTAINTISNPAKGLIVYDSSLKRSIVNTGTAVLPNWQPVGNGVAIAASNLVRLGNTSTFSIGGFTDWTNISDGRFKKNIREDVKGLDFIMKLRPVTYQLDIFPLSKKLNETTDKTVNADMQKAMKEKESMIQSGFIAQEVEQAAKELNYDFSGVDKPKTENDLHGLRYAEFVVPLVKAIQEQQKIIEKQQQQIENQKKDFEEMKRTAASYEAEIMELQKKMIRLELNLVTMQ